MYHSNMSATASRLRLTPADTVSVFHALSDETRLAVLEMLRGGERCVCDLQEAVGAAQSRLSFHLKVLKDAGLVRDRKEGRWSYYTLDPERLGEAAASLGALATSDPVRRAGPILHSIKRVSVGTAARGNRATRTVGKPDGCC